MPFHRFHDSKENVSQVDFKNAAAWKIFRHKKRVVAIFVCFILLAITLSVVLWVTLKSKAKQLPQFEDMEGDMKKSADPCNNFFEYSCGNYISRNLPHPYTTKVVLKNRFVDLGKKNIFAAKSAIEEMSKTSDPVFKKAHSYYTTCMNGHRNMDVFWKAAKSIGDSQLTSKFFSISSWSSDDALLKMKRDYDTNPLFSLEIGNDLLNSSKNIFLIKPPDVALIGKLELDDNPQRKRPKYPGHVLEDDVESIQAVVKNFQTNIKDIFVDASNTYTGGQRYYAILSALEDGLKFESTLVKDIIAATKGMVLHKIYKRVTISRLTKLTGGNINWIKLLSGIASENVNNQTLVGLMVPTKYLSKVGTYLSKTILYGNRRKLPSFFAWTLLKRLSPALPDDYFATYYFKTMASGIGTTGKERWRACLTDTEKRMPLTVGMMFTKKVISSDTFNKTTILLNEVRNAFYNNVDRIPWLDATTRSAVKEKLKYLVYFISNPEMLNSSSLLIRYKDVTARTDNLGQFFLSCVRNLVQINFRQINKVHSRSRISKDLSVMKLYDVNAFYARTKNTIMVLAGILRSPFFYTSGPSYLNYGKIASILGHELLHGYDSHGWYFDKTGQIAPWWTSAAAAAFDKRKTCLVGQYGNYWYGSNNVNGSKTLAENIADNGGLKYAYMAYKSYSKKIQDEKKPKGLKNLSYDQLFFLAYAQMWCQVASNNVKSYLIRRDTHSPNKFRVIGSLSNFAPFAKAYKCASGTKMNPTKKCLFW